MAVSSHHHAHTRPMRFISLTASYGLIRAKETVAPDSIRGPDLDSGSCPGFSSGAGRNDDAPDGKFPESSISSAKRSLFRTVALVYQQENHLDHCSVIASKLITRCIFSSRPACRPIIIL